MVQMVDWSHSTVLAAEPTSASEARDFVSTHLFAHALTHLVDDMRLVVSELATNAVAHAKTPFTVTLLESNESIIVAIEDGSDSVPVRAAPDVLNTSGRGLMLVEELSDGWGTRSDGHGLKSVWASFPSRPWQPESPPTPHG
jgi:anti-sigma regulatory factor (Ser/Thr protein kinase)